MLITYVAELKKLDEKNERIVRTIEHLREPISEISEQDLAEARQLINDYVAQLQTLPQDLPYRELRLTHNLYVEKVSQSIELSGDKGREMKREKSNVDIGVRHIEKFTKRHHNGMSVLVGAS